MRLHRLRLRAFGPFATEQSIDFEPLGAGGLFLLDGPTGAGKSTVLDAITFALYGPGEGGGWGRLHSHFAAPGVEPEVALEFSLRGVRQRITRTPEYPRPKRRGAGSTIERAQVHLERLEDGRWVSRSCRKDEVGEMLADDLGLTRDQFTQVVLLPQGEFARFLRATDDERRTVLTRLFGTQLYDRITDELDRRRQAAARALDAAEARLVARLGAAIEAAGLSAVEHDEFAALDHGERDARLASLGQRLRTAARVAQQAADAAATELALARHEADIAEVRADRIDRFVAATTAYARHEATRADYEQAAVVLEAAARAESVRALLAEHDDATQALDAAMAQLAAVTPRPRAEWQRGQGGAELAARAAVAAAEAAALRHAAEREASAGSVQAELSAARAALSVAAGTVELLAARERELPAALEAAAVRTNAARAALAALPAARERHSALHARVRAAEDLAELEPMREAARAARDAAFTAYEAAVTRHLELVEARLTNMAAELAADLVDGQPCAVCGSVQHPAPAQPHPHAASADQVSAAEALRRDAETARELAAQTVADLDARHAALAAAAAFPPGRHVTVLRSELAAELAAAAAAVADHTASAAGLPDAEQSQAALEVEVGELVTAQREAAAALASAQARVEAATRAVDDLDRELTAAADGHSSVAARRQALEVEVATWSKTADAVTALAAGRARFERADERARHEAEAAGFADLAAARAAVLPRAQLAELRAVTSEWESIARRLQDAVDVAEFAGLDAADREAAHAEAVSARVRLAEAGAAANQLALQHDRARRATERFVAAFAEVEAARRERDEIAAEAAPVVHLAKLARGVAGQRRVNLTTYVLRQWFDQVVAAANVRLTGMSSGRYELVRVDEGSSRTERSGLTLQVLDRHTGERRNPRSLSGGETFYTSLALALGLADVVRAEAGGVDLDTLFIDEGFGSLDADTLDQVMAVIDELRDRGRTVGVVSHVHELKSRIAERIEVRRLPDGSSTLRVVA